MPRSGPNTQIVAAGLATAAVVSILYFWYSSKQEDALMNKKKLLVGDDSSASTPNRGGKDEKTPLTKNGKKDDEKNLHVQIEDLDKQGKALFKNKQVSELFFGTQLDLSLFPLLTVSIMSFV